MKWIKDEIKLSGNSVDILPLREEHFTALLALAKDRRIWEFYIDDYSNEAVMIAALEAALKEKEKGSQYPFVILHKATNAIIGSTRFVDIQPQHRKLEIGWTWLHPDYWATHINPECKLLLLRHCFEKLNAVRVQLKTDERNIRSRTAILKIGATYEGILRHDMLRADGTHRNSAYFSVLPHEWDAAAAKIQLLIDTRS